MSDGHLSTKAAQIVKLVSFYYEEEVGDEPMKVAQSYSTLLKKIDKIIRPSLANDNSIEIELPDEDRFLMIKKPDGTVEVDFYSKKGKMLFIKPVSGNSLEFSFVEKKHYISRR